MFQEKSEVPAASAETLVNNDTAFESDFSDTESSDELDYFSACDEGHTETPNQRKAKPDHFRRFRELATTAASKFWSLGGKSKSFRETGNLPLETIIQIMSYIDDTEKRVLYASLQIDRKWHAASVSKFWQEIDINTSEKWEKFQEICLTEPPHRYTSFINSIRLAEIADSLSMGSWDRLIRSCANLKHMTLDSVTIEPFFIEYYLRESISVPNESTNERPPIRAKPSLSDFRIDSKFMDAKTQQVYYLEHLKSLAITRSPELHANTLMQLAFHAPNLTSLSLAGINTLLEGDLCKVLGLLQSLTELKLGDMRSARAPFSSTRGFGAYQGAQLAVALKNCTKLTAIHLNGLTSLRPLAFTAILAALQDDLPSVQPTRLAALSLHGCTSQFEDGVLRAALASPFLVSALTNLAITEAHSLTNGTFVAAMRACASSLRVLEVGPGLNLADYALSAVPQFCSGLVSLTCVGLARCVDVAAFVGYRFDKLETLVLREMRELKEVRRLVVPSRKRSAWRAAVDNAMCGVGNYHERDDIDTSSDDDMEFVDSMEVLDNPLVVEFAGQANPVNIMMETVAAQRVAGRGTKARR